ncbi:O-linked N-acetylglucosamine transferase, SPINDLY family protein [Pectinatus haikarae]|uniref:O-linked N-acetylglucosamine transferase, SPINDLY family protein n=1 Tax=Pectinatus haikarae TaxID=349096 RepID=UPI0018C6D600|nr:hypothetical protein [Pectinatus haikarae]
MQNKYEDIYLEQISKLNEVMRAGQFSEAIALAVKILKINPDDYNTLFCLSKSYIRLDRKEKAHKVIKHLLKVLAEANEWEPLYYLAKLQLKNTQTAGKVVTAKKLLTLPDLSDEKKCLIYRLLRDNYVLIGSIGRAAEYAIKSCRLSRNYRDYSKFLFLLHYFKSIKAKHLFAVSMGIQDFFPQIIQYQHKFSNEMVPAKIRIGYISPNFNKHAVSLFIYHLIANYNKKDFEVYCYANCKEDPISAQLKQFPEKWTSIYGMTDEEAAKRIYEDKIDILVDLAGHTDNNAVAVLVQKPAPVQVSGIGYFNTLGLKQVDYFMTDIYCDPLGENNAYFTEKLLRLPHSHLCYTPLNPHLTAKPAPCMKNGYITFGSMNFFSKININVIKTWQKILDEVPRSRLLLKDKIAGYEYALKHVKEYWQKNGIDLSRIEFEPASLNYMKSYYRIDIALDTFPYPGGATTCDALYMGVPVITLVGKRHGSRFGFSLLKNIGGMDECIAFSVKEYVYNAVSLAKNSEKINKYHLNLYKKMIDSPVMNADTYMKDVERAYKVIWRKYVKRV